MTPTRDPRTTAAVDAIARFGPAAASERELVEFAVLAALDEGEGTIDSHALATALHRRRVDERGDRVCWTQAKDYLQFLLREQVAHVCHYAVEGGRYRIHRAEVCSTECTDRRRHWRVAELPSGPPCPACFVGALPTGDCPVCGEPVGAVPVG